MWSGVLVMLFAGVLALGLCWKTKKENRRVWSKQKGSYECSGFMELQVQRQIQVQRKVEHLWRQYIEEISRTKDLLLTFAGDNVQVEHTQLRSQKRNFDTQELESHVKEALREGENYNFQSIISHFHIDLGTAELYQVRRSITSGHYNNQNRNTSLKEEEQLHDILAAGRKRTRMRTLDSIIAMEIKHRNFWKGLWPNILWALHVPVVFFQAKWGMFVARMRNEQADRQRQRERYKEWTAQIERKATAEASKVVPVSDLQLKMKARDEKVRVALELAKVEAAVKFEADKQANKLENERKLETAVGGHTDRNERQL